MQHMGPFDASQNKALFKKRIHRPWNTSLEVPLAEESTAPIVTPHAVAPDIEIVPDSPKAHAEAVLIGGFFYPTQNAGHPLENNTAINNLMQELKTKEQDILQEEIRKAEAAQIHEASARKSAEENALFAIQKAKLAAEQAHKAETQVLAEKQLRLELERTKKALEDRLQSALKTLEEKEAQRLEAGKSRQELEEKLLIVKTQMDARVAVIQRETDRKIQEAQEQIAFHEKAKLTSQSFTQKTMESARQSEAARLVLEEQVDVLERKNGSCLEQIQAIELQKKSAEDNLALSKTLLAQALEQTQHLESIVEVEKELRKHCDQKMMESHVRAEEAKRKVFEDRIILMEQEITALDMEKSRVEEKLFKMQRSIRNLEIMRLSTDT